MNASLKQILKDWWKTKQWKTDAARGWEKLQATGASAADRSFKEIELVRLRYRSERIGVKLFETYQALGKKVADHWAGIHLLVEDEKKRDMRRIRLLLEEQKKTAEQIRELEEPIPPAKEAFSEEEK